MAYKFNDDIIGQTLYWIITVALAVVLFLICRGLDYHFFSGVYYSGSSLHLWLPCVFLASTASIIIVWLIRRTTGKPIWWLLVAGLVLLTVWLSGLARLLPWPILSDCVLGVLTANAVYWSVVAGDW